MHLGNLNMKQLYKRAAGHTSLPAYSKFKFHFVFFITSFVLNYGGGPVHEVVHGPGIHEWSSHPPQRRDTKIDNRLGNLGLYTN